MPIPDPEHVARALQAGVCGFLVKSDPFDQILAQIVGRLSPNGTPCKVRPHPLNSRRAPVVKHI